MREGRHLPLVGRAGELSFALGVVNRVAAATGQALFIEGEAGIGKTRLLDEVLDAAEDEGLRVLRGAGGQLEADVGFTPLVDALGLRADAKDGRRSALGRLLVAEPDTPPGHGSDGAQRRQQMVQGIVDLVEELCGEAPLVLALEDAHWVDEPSLAVVDRLARRLVHLPLLLVLTARPYPRSTALDGVVDRLLTGGAAHLALTALPDEAMADLAATVLRADPGPTLLTELAAVAGNPLFGTELLAALQDDDAVMIDQGRADLSEARIPPSLRLTVLRRLSMLPTATVDLLRLAAVLGTVFDPAALAAVAQRPGPDVVRELEPARQAGVIADTEGRLAFRHDLVRDAIYHDLPEAVRQSLHDDAANAMAAAGFPAERTAPHLLRAALTADEATIEQLRRVATDIAPRAPDLAVDLLYRALQLASDGQPEPAELRVELAVALAWAQRPNEVVAVADSVLAELHAGPLRRTALVIRALQAQFLGGFERFRQDLEASAAEHNATQGERARLLALATASWVFSDEPGRALVVGRQALRAAEHAGDDVALCGTLQSLAVASEVVIDEQQAIAFARRAVAVSRQSRDPELRRLLVPELTLGTILGNLPAHRDEAIALLRSSVTQSEDRRLPEFAANAQLALGATLHRAGHWDEAIIELETGVGRALELGRAAGTVVDAFCRMARIAVRRDDVPGAQAWLDRAAAALDPDALPTPHAVQYAVARAQLLDAAGQRDAATQLLAHTYAETPPPVRAALAPLIGVPLVRLSIATDRERISASAVVADLVDDGTDPTAPWLGGILDGDPQAIDEALERARSHGTALREELPLLYEDAAGVLVAANRTEEAIALLGEAIDAWQEMDAVRDIARLEAKLRDLGVRRGKRGSRQRPSTGWEALTETEQRVVELVAEGLIYREVGERLFISRRTVETHVAHVFAKLGVTNRRELETAYAQRHVSRSTTG